MAYARAVIAAVLATGLVVIVVLQEIADAPDSIERSENGLVIDGTFALLMIAVIILTVPDAIAYFKHRKLPEKEEEDDSVV